MKMDILFVNLVLLFVFLFIKLDSIVGPCVCWPGFLKAENTVKVWWVNTYMWSSVKWGRVTLFQCTQTCERNQC